MYSTRLLKGLMYFDQSAITVVCFLLPRTICYTTVLLRIDNGKVRMSAGLGLMLLYVYIFIYVYILLLYINQSINCSFY